MTPIDTTGADILALPIKPREPREGEPFLSVVDQPCSHWQGPFQIDADAGKCFCKRCGGEVSPMFVLEQLMHVESRWMRTRAAYLDEMQRLGERIRTKCRHCGEMTAISRT